MQHFYNKYVFLFYLSTLSLIQFLKVINASKMIPFCIYFDITNIISLIPTAKSQLVPLNYPKCTTHNFSHIISYNPSLNLNSLSQLFSNHLKNRTLPPQYPYTGVTFKLNHVFLHIFPTKTKNDTLNFYAQSITLVY